MEQVSHPGDYERTDADPRVVAGLAAGVAVFLLITPFLLLALYPSSRTAGRAPPRPQPPGPRLQVDPKADLDRLHATEHTQLESFGWIDRANGITRIPIERAIELLNARGLPGWPSQTNR
jgi:hypothetical protein